MPFTAFRQNLGELTAQIAGRSLDSDLADWLNREHGAGSPACEQLRQHCQTGVAEGWLCEREGGGIRYGRRAGWLVCPPGSAHRPTVTSGRALVLYLLPEGRIDFTR